MTDGSVNLYYITAAGNASARSWAPPVRSTGSLYTKRAGSTARPSRTKPHLPGNSPPAS